MTREEFNESMVEVNRYLVQRDLEIIENFVKRHNWDMETTETGLWYMIYERGTGEMATKGKLATVAYTLSLLDGTVCYQVDVSSPKTFQVGQGGVESGLEEGILWLREGDKARFILPPYLAHGLLGDEERIPARAIILYDMTLLKVSEK